MSVIKFVRDFSTLFNWDTDDNPTTEQDYQNAVKNWTETEMNIVDTLLWQPTTEYATGNIVKTPSLPSQYVLRCAEAGTSGSTEPSYSGAGAGDTVTDGTVEWVIVSLATGNAADADASNIGVNAEVDNSEAWASAIGGGAVAEDDVRLVKGGTVYAVTSELASDIADNTDDIATNTENISQNTTDIGIADKRITNIEKLLQGNLYDYQTDFTSAYTKTVPSGAMPYAGIEQIGGKTVVMNQLMPAVNATNFNHPVNATVSFADGICSFTATAQNGIVWRGSSSPKQIHFLANHKYYLGCNFKAYAGATIYVYFAGGNYTHTYSVTDTNWVLSSSIITADSSFYPSTDFGVTDKTAGGWQEVQFKNVMCIDLTLMFGAGNEPSTAEEFETMFPADWYAYNEGTLLSAGVTEVVSKKADTTEIATYPIPASIRNLEGYGWSAGTAYNYIDFERKVFVQNVARVDLGSLNWKSSENHFYTQGVISSIVTTYNSRIANIVNAVYPTISFNSLKTYETNKVCSVGSSSSSSGKNVQIYDTSYATTDALKASLNGVYLYYELATPVETDISAYLTDDNLIEVEAGGTLTFPNSNGTDYQIPVPSDVTYMIDLQEAINNG